MASNQGCERSTGRSAGRLVKSQPGPTVRQMVSCIGRCFLMPAFANGRRCFPERPCSVTRRCWRREKFEPLFQMEDGPSPKPRCLVQTAIPYPVFVCLFFENVFPRNKYGCGFSSGCPLGCFSIVRHACMDQFCWCHVGVSQFSSQMTPVLISKLGASGCFLVSKRFILQDPR